MQQPRFSSRYPALHLTMLAILVAALLLGAPSTPQTSASSAESGEGQSGDRPSAIQVASPDPQAARNASPAAGECRPSDAAAAEEEPWLAYPTVRRSLAGMWREALKHRAPRLRIPGTKDVDIRRPRQEEVDNGGRWLPGYRPATPQARAEYDAWQADRNSSKASAEGASTAQAPSSAYADNLMGRQSSSGDLPDEEISHSVRVESYPASTIDLREIAEVLEETPKKGGSLSDYHHGSGLTWNEYLQMKEMAKLSPTTSEAQEATQESVRTPGAGLMGFDAIGSSYVIVPPDPIMAVGPYHLIALVNSRYQVWDKSGGPLTQEITFNTFFNGVPNCQGVFDPFVDYDEANDRFVIGGITVSGSGPVDSYLCVAATTSPNPTTGWHRYSFRADAVATGQWLDFPHMGIGLDGVYITGNMFDDGGYFDHIRAYALDKDDLYAGNALSVAEADLGGQYFTAQPVKIHGYSSGGWPEPGTPHHFIAHNAGGNSRIWRWSDPLVSAPVVYGTIAENFFHGAPPNAPELGGTVNDLNDTGSGKWLDAEYRDGKIWTTRNVACDFGGGSSESCIDWIQVDVSGSGPILTQQQSGGAYGTANEFRYYPDLSVDRNNNIAIGYTKSSAATYTQVWIAGREFNDPFGTLQPESLVRAGLGNYTDGAGCGGSCDRWGDYTGLTVDPDGCTFWYIGQFSDGGSWGWDTYIGNFTYDSCSVDSSLRLDRGTYTCDDSMQITVTDSTPIDSSTVSAQTTIYASSGDSETIPAGSWVGSDCTGGDCGTWSATLPVSGAPGSSDDGTLNVGHGDTITVDYVDPHAGHDDQTRDVAAGCQTRFDDGGYLIDGGCEAQAGTETYRDYMDGGEYIAYTFGIYNPPSAPALTDVQATLSISGPAADKVTIFNPTVYIGPVAQGTLSAAVFQLYIDPSIDTAAFRMSEHDLNLGVISVADGYTTAQVVNHQQLLQADDNIVTESQCWNYESGDQGFVNARYEYQYDCGSAEGCPLPRVINTVEAPWTRGSGCGSETRDDYPEMTCDVNGTSAFKPNADPAACGTFAESLFTMTDDILFSPVFSPNNSGTAASGQPWFYNWRYAEWFYRSEMVSGTDPAMAFGMFWDNDYQGVSTPASNEINLYYSFFHGYSYYANRSWDSATAWDPLSPPFNFDGISFGAGSSGEATPGLQWRWAVEVFDTDYGENPTNTPATAGLSVDNLNLVYDQYYADEQVGVCTDPPGVVALDQGTYQECPNGLLTVSVLDGNAPDRITVTATADGTGDSETFSLSGPGPHFTTDLAYSTADGAAANDDTLFVTPTDTVRVTYEDNDPVGQSTTLAFIFCPGGDVVVDGIGGLQDNGDGDTYADTNETVDFSINIRNNTNQSLENVTAYISTDDSTVDCILKDSASFGSIAANGATSSNDLMADPFTFKVSNTTECADPATPPNVKFTVHIVADGFAGSATPQTITMVLDLNDLPATGTFTEDFTTDTPAFHHQLGPGDDDGASSSPDGNSCSPYVDEFFWKNKGGNTGGAYFCWKNTANSFPAGTYSDLNDSALYSPVLKIGSSSTTLSFDHEYEFGWQGTYRVDGARVDYSVNGGVWQKLTTLPYDGALIFNTYCNPLCNGNELGLPCFSENTGNGENIFNQLDAGAVLWTNVSGAVLDLTPGDQVQFRWRVGSMNTSFFGISTQGGYGLDNVSVTNVVQQECDSAVNPDSGCGVVFDASGNLVQVCGDDDAIVEPTERWAVDVDLRNSAVGSAVNTMADLVLSGRSPIAATVVGNPGSYGTLAPDGGIGTATYQFIVDSGAVCVSDIAFDLVDISDDAWIYNDQPGAFTVPVGSLTANDTATQSVNPISASGSSAASSLLPALTTATPAGSAVLSYNFSYDNEDPGEIAYQDSDPISAINRVSISLLAPAFTLSAQAPTSATVDWTTLAYAGDLDGCTRVFLRTPNGTDIDLKPQDVAPANPYDVLSIYQGPNGGPGQYSIGLEEFGGNCRDLATLSGTAMTLAGDPSTGTWTANARVLLWDGSTAHLLKDFGETDLNPYDVSLIYNAAGPGTYEIRLEETGGGGSANLSSAAMTVRGVECDLGCTSVAPPAPPLADGATGTAMTLDKGAGTDELLITIDNVTCSESRAVVVYGDIGDFSGYQGAVTTGCDIGTGPAASITHTGDNVWFNIIWVNPDEAAGHPGFSSSGSRSWGAAGLCGTATDDPSDAVCN